MGILRQYWARLDNRRLRLAGALTLLVALLLELNNPLGSAWNHVGMVLGLVGMTGLVLVFSLPRKKS